MICAQLIQSNGVSYVSPTGQAVCQPSDLVLLTSAEYQHAVSPFYLDVESAVAITAAIAGLWAVAFVIAMAKKAVLSPDGEES